MKTNKIKGLYEKRGWYYYQPPTGENGVRPKAIALGTRDFLEAINLSYSERERFQLVAAAVKDRMSQAIDLYLKEKLAARKHGPKTSYNTGKALYQICAEMGNPKLSEINEKKIEEWATNLRARKCRVAIRVKEAAGIGHHNLVAGGTVRNMGTSGIFMGQGAKQTFPHITHDDYEGEPMSHRIGNLQAHIYKYTTWDRKAGHDHTILSCDVYDTGCGGIHLSGGLKKGLVRGNNQVINCKIHDYNRRNKFLWSGINIDGCGNRIAHCEIYNSDFQGIYCRGNDQLYEYNHIHHVSLDSDDTSPWYVGRDPGDRGHLIRYNFFHDCGNPKRMQMGIYCDDGACGVTAYGNVFYKFNFTRGVMYTNAGSDLKFLNNIVIDTPFHIVENSSMFYTWGKKHVPTFFPENGLYGRRLHAVDYKNPPYSVRYPELTAHLDPIPGANNEFVGMRPARDLMADNVIVRSGKLVVLKGENAMFEQRDNLQTQEDPGFVDAAKLNFKLKDDSVVFKQLLNFKPIPFEKIGLYNDDYRKAERAN